MRRTLGIYPKSEGLLIDYEDAISKNPNRVKGFSWPFEVPETNFQMVQGVCYDINNTFKLINDIAMQKKDNPKEWQIDSPFIDPFTGKQAKAWIPHIIFTDSLTAMFTDEEIDMLLDSGIGTGKAKTYAMANGNAKAVFIGAVRRYAELYGMCFLMTAQIGDKIEMDHFPSAKESPFMKQKDKAKGASAIFKTLCSNLFQMISCKVLKDGDDPHYPFRNSPTDDVQEVTVQLIRTKTIGSGPATPIITSQEYGLLDSVTNFHYLKLNNGLLGNNRKQQAPLLPDVTISRNTVREQTLENAQLRRALEISAQLCYIKHHWCTNKIPLNFNISDEDMLKKLTEKKMLDRVLNSRGYWTYDENNKQEYFACLDLLQMVQ
jgi:hypothetical protein